MNDPTPTKGSSHYKKTYSRDDLNAAEKKAREEGKKDVILSRLVDGQEDHDRIIHEIRERLISGDSLIEQMGSRLNERDAQIATIAKSLDQHLRECEDRKRKEDATRVKLSTQEKKALSEGMRFAITIATNIITIAIIGGLYAYFQAKGGP